MAKQQPNLSTSFYDKVSYSYTDALSIELAELQRTIYLPLLPMERLSHSVLTAYEEEKVPYWNKDEVYTSVLGNFYVPMLFPMVENPEESTDMIHPAPENSMLLQDGGYETSEYTTRTYIELVIPKYIVMNFNDIIPKGTMFVVGFVGGSNTIDSMRIMSVAWLPEEDVDENYHGEGPNEPMPGRGDQGKPSKPIEKNTHEQAEKTYEEREGYDTKRSKVVDVNSATTNKVTWGKTHYIPGAPSNIRTYGSGNVRYGTTKDGRPVINTDTQTIYNAPKRTRTPSPFSTMVDLSGLNMATVRKKVHEDLELIRQETIRRQALNARRNIIHG